MSNNILLLTKEIFREECTSRNYESDPDSTLFFLVFIFWRIYMGYENYQCETNIAYVSGTHPVILRSIQTRNAVQHPNVHHTNGYARNYPRA